MLAWAVAWTARATEVAPDDGSMAPPVALPAPRPRWNADYRGRRALLHLSPPRALFAARSPALEARRLDERLARTRGASRGPRCPLPARTVGPVENQRGDHLMTGAGAARRAGARRLSSGREGAAGRARQEARTQRSLEGEPCSATMTLDSAPWRKAAPSGTSMGTK